MCWGSTWCVARDVSLQKPLMNFLFTALKQEFECSVVIHVSATNIMSVLEQYRKETSDSCVEELT